MTNTPAEIADDGWLSVQHIVPYVQGNVAAIVGAWEERSGRRPRMGTRPPTPHRRHRTTTCSGYARPSTSSNNAGPPWAGAAPTTTFDAGSQQ